LPLLKFQPSYFHCSTELITDYSADSQPILKTSSGAVIIQHQIKCEDFHQRVIKADGEGGCRHLSELSRSSISECEIGLEKKTQPR